MALADRPADEWVSLLTAARVPAGRVNTITEAFALAGELGLGSVIELTDETTGATVRQVANPLTFSVTPTGYRSPPPRLGGHPDAHWRSRPPEMTPTIGADMADLTTDQLLGLELMLNEEELAWQQRARTFARERIEPVIDADFEDRRFRKELVAELGAAGFLGMHLTGYGAAGASAVSYGLVCLELEAADSAWRTLVSVQGSLAMSAIAKFGSDEQKEQWLPGMVAGTLIGCFALTEPASGSDPASMQTQRAARRRRLGAHRRQALDRTGERSGCRDRLGGDRRRRARFRRADRHPRLPGGADRRQALDARLGAVRRVL